MIAAYRIYTMNNSQRDYSIIDTLNAQINDTHTGIKNILSAIKSGVVSKALTDELAQLENQLIDLNYALEQEKAKAPEITQKQIEYMLYRFRDEYCSDEYSDKLVEAFVNRIYYSKDKLVIWLNYSKTPLGDEKAEIEKIVIDCINKNREQGSSVLCYGGPSRTRT